MGSTYRYIGTEDENELVAQWFTSLNEQPKIIETGKGIYVWFQNIGELARTESGELDAKNSPLVTVFPIKRIRTVLLSVGEVHFLPAWTEEKFPELEKINRKFRNWIKKNELVLSRSPKFDRKWDYYLEGSVRNWDSDIYAFAGGIQALEQGQYFVSESDSEGRLDVLCKALALRGVEVPSDA